jgi:hypothetical protein
MDGSELLWTLHSPKSLYRSLWSSAGHRAVLRLIAAHLTAMGIVSDLDEVKVQRRGGDGPPICF